jgi:outer membrane protein insertion porin family
MLRQFKKAFFLLIIIPAVIFPQKVSSINVESINHFSNDDILNWAGIHEGEKFYAGMLDSIKANLAHNLQERGYLNVDFSNCSLTFSPDSQTVSININIQENEPTYFNEFSIKFSDSVEVQQIVQDFSFLKNQIYSKSSLEDNIEEALALLENNGYPFAAITINSIYFYKDESGKNLADVFINIGKGKKRLIDKIEIEGNAATNDNVIKRELGIKKGDEYVQEKIDDIPRRLNKLGIFEPVEKPTFYINSDEQGVLLIKVKEEQTNNFDGVIGYVPSSSPGQSGYLTGLVDVSMRNLFGTGRAASIHWQQLSETSQQLELKYLEPWLFGYPFNITGDLYQRKQDTSYIQRKFRVDLEFIATDIFSGSVFISTEAVIPTLTDSTIFSVYNSNSFVSGLSLKLDTRDDPYSPTSGVLFINSYSLSQKKITGPAQFLTPDVRRKVNLQRIEIDLDGYYQLFNKQVVALGIHGRELRGPFFEISDLYRLGGTNTLRGYREDQFLGSRVLWTNLEYRFLLTQRTFLFLFLDTGYYFSPAEPDLNITKQEGYKAGYGLGIDLETSFGVISVSFALAQGDNFSDGKIHFGLVNEF